MAMSENSKLVLNCVKDAASAMVYTQIAEATGLGGRQVTGCLTGLKKKGLVDSESVEVELADGSHKTMKAYTITDSGKTFDPDATEAE